jgi:hypothetical protein
MSSLDNSKTIPFFLERVQQADIVSSEVCYELNGKKMWNTITEEEEIQLYAHQLRKQLGLHPQLVFTLEFLKIYLWAGPYIHKVRTMLPTHHVFDSSAEALHLLKGHNRYKKGFERKLVLLTKMEKDTEGAFLQTSIQKVKCEVDHVLATAAHTLLNHMGFEWFGDQQTKEGDILDTLWRTQGFEWFKQNIKTAKIVFQVRLYRKQLAADSSRKQYLGFINTILHQGLGVTIHKLGDGHVEKNTFGLHFDYPVNIDGYGMCRSQGHGVNQDGKEEHILTLKPINEKQVFEV